MDYIHSNCWGPSHVESLGGHKYCVSFIDDFSRMTWLIIMKSKGEAFKNFKQMHWWKIKLGRRSKGYELIMVWSSAC